MQKLLVSVRGKNEAMEAVKGGAHIIDAEYPGSALGTQYPLNIYAIREAVPLDRLVATNIGEKQFIWSTASQAALGVAFAGADIIKAGLAELNPTLALRVLKTIVHHVKYWYPWKIIIPAFFADVELRKCLNPITQSQEVALNAGAQGVLIDTFDKAKRMDLLSYYSLKDIERFVRKCHSMKIEAWIAGSIKRDQLPKLWETGVDVICVRAAACEVMKDTSIRMGKIKKEIVAELVKTIPSI
jgi:uncharacterized protein (UPF0264 family)